MVTANRMARIGEVTEISPGNISELTHGWKVEFHRKGDSEMVTIGIFGDRGGLKARLWISLSQLKEAIKDLEAN